MEDTPRTPSPTPHWDRRFPGRFQLELDAFKAAAVDPIIDRAALAEGRLVLEFEWPHENRVIPIKAVYPDAYPFLRPHVAITNPALFPKRHISPIEGNICLLGRDSRQWPSSWTVPDLLQEQLQGALNPSDNEDPQGEPTEYWWNIFGAGSSSYCLIDSSWSVAGIEAPTAGKLCIRYSFDDENADNPNIRAVVTKIAREDGKIIAEWNGALPPSLQGAHTRELVIPWERLSKPPLPNHLSKTHNGLETLAGTDIARSSPQFFTSKLSKRRFRFNAFLYSSELEWKREGDSWLFALIHGSSKALDGRPGKSASARIVRTLRGGPSDLISRAPAVSVLSNKVVALIGVGALGAPLAIEFARIGVRELRLMDFDIVEPGNSMRWPLGANAWGQPKLDALARFIRNEYPQTNVKTISHSLGSVSDVYPFGDERAITDLVDGASLVVDATASFGATNFVYDFVSRRDLHLLVLYASPPVAGGLVALFSPAGGCPVCLEHAWHDESIRPPLGMDEEGELVQPPGCAERTFAGTSFDLQELSLQAMRVAVPFLAEKTKRPSSVVYTLNFHESGGLKIPFWCEDTLTSHLKCTCQKS